jgi:hypothetical protein
VFTLSSKSSISKQNKRKKKGGEGRKGEEREREKKKEKKAYFDLLSGPGLRNCIQDHAGHGKRPGQTDFLS